MQETKYGSACKAVPGYDVKIIKPDHSIAKPNEMGDIVIKLPLPPGTFSKFSAHLIVSGSALSPAKNNDSNELKSYLEKNLPSGSSFFIALNAVGAVNKDLILYSDITLQNTPASGVPTGFPSNNTVVHPLNRGA